MNELIQLDHYLLNLINQAWANPFFDWLMPNITDLHKTTFFAIGFVPFIFVLMIRSKGFKSGSYHFVLLLLTLGLTDLAGNHLFKKNFQRLRPGDNPEVHVQVRSGYGGYSFISNHAANMGAAATYTFYFFPQAYWVVAPVAALVMYSRVYNGVHFPADVIVGALLGGLIATIVYRLRRRTIEHFSNRTHS